MDTGALGSHGVSGLGPLAMSLGRSQQRVGRIRGADGDGVRAIGRIAARETRDEAARRVTKTVVFHDEILPFSGDNNKQQRPLSLTSFFFFFLKRSA